MEIVPKDFRVIVCEETKFQLKQIFNKNKIKLDYMREQNFQKTSIKLVVLENQMDIYAYNGDLYNMFRKFKKYKKLCFFAIDELEEATGDDKFKVGMFNFDDGTIVENENAYVRFCKYLKENLDYYEDVVNKMYAVYQVKKL